MATRVHTQRLHVTQLYVGAEVGAEATDKSGHGVGRTHCAHVEFWECGWVITAAQRTHLMGKWRLRVANGWQWRGKGSMRAGLLRTTCFPSCESPSWIIQGCQEILEFIHKTTKTLRTNILQLYLYCTNNYRIIHFSQYLLSWQ